MMKRIKKIISVVMTLCVLVLGLLWCIKATERQTSEFKYKPFMEEEKEFDVLFFGSSHLINGINPMKLWEEHGITSYNMGGHGSPITSSYWMYKNAIEYHKPKMVVLDVYFLESQSKGWDVNLTHTQFDIYPLSKTKLAGIRDIFAEKEKQFELIFPFSIYHNRWSEIDINSYVNAFAEREATKTKGAELRYEVAVPADMELIDSTEVVSGNTIGMSYLRRFIEDCKEEGIEIVLINIPFPATIEQQRGGNSAYDIAKEYDVPFINYQYENLVDFTTDCCDANAHLNFAGANKITKHLGEFIKSRYDLQNKKEVQDYSHWNKAYEEYQLYLQEEVRRQNNLKSVLMMSGDESFYVKICSNNGFTLDEVERKLLNQCLEDKNSSYEELMSDEKWSLKIQIYSAIDDALIAEKYYDNLRQIVSIN